MLIICGIDPGDDGAVAFLDPETEGVVSIFSMPALTLAKGKSKKRLISAPTLAVELRRAVPEGATVKAFLELVNSSPQMGVASSFKFGRGYGVVEGALAVLGWPIAEHVTAAKWKRIMACPAEKDDARNRASQLMPAHTELWTPLRRVMNAEQAGGRAEAALIALYGVRVTKHPELLAPKRSVRKKAQKAVVELPSAADLADLFAGT
jgi:hypothetical protein